MTRGTEKEPSDPSNGQVLNGTAVREHAINIPNPNYELAQRLYEIKRNEELNWLLEEWEKQFNASQDSKLHEEARLKHAKNELYQWIGFYSVFQGVVFTGVALSNTIGCRQSWGPTSLSLIASIATIVTVHFKLLDYEQLKTDFERKTIEAKKLHAKLAELKLQGKSFKLSKFSKFQESGESGKKTEGLQHRYYWAAIGVLLLFSSAVVLFCNIALCGPLKYHPGS